MFGGCLLAAVGCAGGDSEPTSQAAGAAGAATAGSGGSSSEAGGSSQGGAGGEAAGGENAGGAAGDAGGTTTVQGKVTLSFSDESKDCNYAPNIPAGVPVDGTFNVSRSGNSLVGDFIDFSIVVPASDGSCASIYMSAKTNSLADETYEVSSDKHYEIQIFFGGKWDAVKNACDPLSGIRSYASTSGKLTVASEEEKTLLALSSNKMEPIFIASAPGVAEGTFLLSGELVLPKIPGL